MELEDLQVYQESLEISRLAWAIYEKMEWHDKKIIGDQWIESIDSIGANIAEGFGRFHYLDKNKFNYNARGSLLESLHWTGLLLERGKMSESEHIALSGKIKTLHPRLNAYIAVTRKNAVEEK